MEITDMHCTALITVCDTRMECQSTEPGFSRPQGQAASRIRARKGHKRRVGADLIVIRPIRVFARRTGNLVETNREELAVTTAVARV
jgi:hypothetical protein